MQEIRSSGDIVEPEASCRAAVRGLARRWFVDGGLFGRMSQLFFPFRAAALENRHEIAILYFGRTSEFLMMTSERMAIPGGICTLAQVMERLRVRGGRWVAELDDSHAMYAVNGQGAGLRDTISAGDEIRISSKKSIFEA